MRAKKQVEVMARAKKLEKQIGNSRRKWTAGISRGLHYNLVMIYLRFRNEEIIKFIINSFSCNLIKLREK